MKKNLKAPWWDEAREYLSTKDKTLNKIIIKYDTGFLQSRGDPFTALCRTIIGQQISVKAAASIFNKFELKVKKINYKNVLELNINEIKKCGLSYKKCEYIIGLANFFNNNQSKIKSWNNLSDEIVIKELCELNGIGPWSAEMFLMFCLLRPNILPLGDLGLRKAVGIHYLNKTNPTYEEVSNIAKNWTPYCSAATWYMWRSIDPTDVEY